MTDNDLNRAVARATGETVSEIRSRGFGLLMPLPAEPDPEDFAQSTQSRDCEGSIHHRPGVHRPALSSQA